MQPPDNTSLERMRRHLLAFLEAIEREMKLNGQLDITTKEIRQAYKNLTNLT